MIVGEPPTPFSYKREAAKSGKMSSLDDVELDGTEKR